jgi:glycerophosphoryl diester phosphodiesterase
MVNRDLFARPIAHRGLHAPSAGRVENSMSAFRAAVERGYAIECDIQPAADHVPMVFHDDRLERLTGQSGLISDRKSSELVRLSLNGSEDRIPRLSDLLDLVASRVPLIVEIKSVWTALPAPYLDEVAGRLAAYRGPVAVMSFDPAVMVEMRSRVPEVPRGIVSGVYRDTGWWSDVLDADRRQRLTHLLESADAAPDFYSYHVKDLPTPVTRYVREVQRVPLICWTVRTPEDRAIAARWSDAPTFEGYEP